MHLMLLSTMIPSTISITQLSRIWTCELKCNDKFPSYKKKLQSIKAQGDHNTLRPWRNNFAENGDSRDRVRMYAPICLQPVGGGGECVRARRRGCCKVIVVVYAEIVKTETISINRYIFFFQNTTAKIYK